MNKVIPVSILTAALLTACGEGEDRQARYLERAQEYFAEDNFDKARVDARNVLQISPKNLEARTLLADIHFAEGDLRKAYGNYMAVHEEDNVFVPANVGLTKVFTAVKDFDKAMLHADKVLSVEPENIETLGYKAIVLAGLQQMDKAREVAEQTLALDAGNAAALGVMSQVLVQGGDPDAALTLIDKGQAVNSDDDRLSMMKIAILESTSDKTGVEAELKKLTARHPDSDNYSTTLIRYYIRDTRFDEAEAEARRFVEENPESMDAKRRLIAYLRQHKTVDSAIEQANQFIKDESDQHEHRITLAQLYLFTGEQEQGEKVLEEAINADPRSVASINARNILTQLRMSEEDYESAGKLIGEILDIEPENEQALLRRAGLHLADNNLVEGIADLRVVLKNNPENALALSGLARAQEANGNERLALDNYKKLMTLQKPTVETLASAARLAIKSEQYPEAERYIRKALELDAENTQLVTNLIRLLALKEDWTEAEAFADGLIDSETSKALGHYLKAGINIQTGNKEAALVDIDNSLKANPAAVESLTARATLLSELKGIEAAISGVAEHCDANPEQAHCPYILGTLYAQDKQLDKAQAELEKSLEINDQLIPAYRQLAKVHAAKKDIPAVEAVIKRGIDLTDRNPLRFELAAVYLGTQRYADAAAVYETILEKNPKSIAATNNLAMIYAENIATPESLKKARSMVVELQESENPAYLDTVGWVMYLNGEYQQAVSYLKAAVDKVGSSPLLQYHLGMAYFKTENLELAKEHLTLATKDDARYTGYEEALETLQAL